MFDIQEYCHRTAVSIEHNSDADLTQYMLLALYCYSRSDPDVGNTIQMHLVHCICQPCGCSQHCMVSLLDSNVPHVVCEEVVHVLELVCHCLGQVLTLSDVRVAAARHIKLLHDLCTLHQVKVDGTDQSAAIGLCT